MNTQITVPAKFAKALSEIAEMAATMDIYLDAEAGASILHALSNVKEADKVEKVTDKVVYSTQAAAHLVLALQKLV